MNWDTIAVHKALRKTAVSRHNQIPTSEIIATGKFPVIDQGQAFIAGYSDAEEHLIKEDLPLVVFGDHTRAIKFVDFPFILGGDGTKILKPKEELFDPRFFAFALQTLDLPSRGYNRHYTILKDRLIPRPELSEQRRIAAILALLDRAVDQRQKLLDLTNELKGSLLRHLMTGHVRVEHIDIAALERFTAG
jgi:type I restriction enzyme, S subunit